MPDEQFARTKLILQFIQTAGIILAVVSLYVSYRVFEDDHEWKRRQFTAELLTNFSARIKDFRGPLIAAFPGLHQGDAAQAPSLVECRQIIRAKKGEYKINSEYDAFEVRGHLMSALNHFEYIAYAWENQLGDQLSIEESFSHVLLRWHRFFENCIAATNAEYGNVDTWPPLTRVVGEWKKHQQKPPKSVTKMGVLSK